MILQEILELFQQHKILVSIQGFHPQGDKSLKLMIPRTDNRLVEPGDIFLCVKGFATDGHRYALDAHNKGASLIVYEDEIKNSIPGIQVSDSRKAVALLARLYYRDPSSKLKIIGVTGTNGKTTTSLLIYQALGKLGYRCGWIGTLGYYLNGKLYPTHNTTPDSMELYKILADMVESGVEYLAMEVSSHALALHRVYGIGFDYCLFTNLSRDHLDFHANMEEYANTKYQLFQNAVSSHGIAIVNCDDGFGKIIEERLSEQKAEIYTISTSAGYYRISETVTCLDGTDFSLTIQGSQVRVHSRLIGSHNVYNLAFTMAVLDRLRIPQDRIVSIIGSLEQVEGRMQKVPNERGLGVYVDYAHSPDAIENVLRTAQTVKQNRIITIIGAGGDRDKGKRPLMLNTALHFSDAVIITDDNPRNEDPDQIILDVVENTGLWLPWWIIRDRKLAIEAAIDLAQPGDVVMILGKGHETYQEIKGIRHHFSDYEVASQYLASRPVPVDKLILPFDPLLLELVLNQVHQISGEGTAPRAYFRISTDSRNLEQASIFIAIKGDRFDGHDFIPVVLLQSGMVIIGEKAKEEIDPTGVATYLQVESSVLAYARLCRKYLLMFPVCKIGLTGSVGKTTTKEMLYNVLSYFAPSLKSAKNENNIIGLCNTILKIRPEHKYAIFELGSNHFGEIASLAETCFPDIGMVLNIGASHLEYFEDENGVYKEKVSLLQRHLNLKLFPADDQRFEHFSREGKSVGGNPKASYQLSDVCIQEAACIFKVNGDQYRIPHPIEFYAINAAFAVAVGLELGYPQAEISKALDQPLESQMRMQIENIGMADLIIDCYNANPVSMQSAIEFWHKYRPEKSHVAILGDMFELGNNSEQYHKMIGAILNEYGYGSLITIGQYSQHYHSLEQAVQNIHFLSVEELLSSGALESISQSSVVLVKASHGIHLEKALPELRLILTSKNRLQNNPGNG
ncbi:MAG: UDP-N-acetylmuramoyl-L-alanyl-D-glutamate--2,6-diaminopimelate ligase [Candidatus Cloacimonetes bacterium]|nr:UDP-N-acetylmuramoyl-L-alanyl-D-glutamate--2,6-diaminopimelate ligase [Candidatus Cloacimonadota bacterium]